jgi:lipopolysaccharide transport system permease protein
MQNKNIVLSLISILSKNRLLAFEMARRDIRDRYVGQIFGYVWFFANSILTVSIYIFLFGFIYKTVSSSAENFPLYLISGIVPWMFLTETMGKSVNSISSNTSLVKQVVFPIEILPVKVILSSFVSLGLNLVILILFSVYVKGFQVIAFMIPVALVFLFLFSLGIAFVLSSVGAFLKDLKDIVQLFCFVGIYLVPIVYLESFIPQQFQFLSVLNPFSHIIFCFQDIFYYGSFKHQLSWFLFPLISLFTVIFGYFLFRRIKTNFGNFI